MLAQWKTFHFCQSSDHLCSRLKGGHLKAPGQLDRIINNEDIGNVDLNQSGDEV